MLSLIVDLEDLVAGWFLGDLVLCGVEAGGVVGLFAEGAHFYWNVVITSHLR